MDNLLYALKGVDFMKTLKKYKILQILIGVFAGFLVLAVGLLMTSIATWEQLPVGNLLSKIILTIFPIMFTAGMTFIAVASKSNGLKFVYYPAFIINVISLVSAIFYYWVDGTMGTTFRRLFSFAKSLGIPFGIYANAVNEKLTYTVNYDGWSDKYSIIPEFDVLVILLLCLLVSLVAYQLYRDNDEHREKLSRWRLPNPARAIAISAICFYGTYILLVMLSYILSPIIELLNSVPIIYEAVCTVFDIVIMLFFWSGYVLVLFGMIIILPLGITIALSVLCVYKAYKTSNLRYVFNPLVISAIILSVFGSYLMYTFVLSGF